MTQPNNAQIREGTRLSVFDCWQQAAQENPGEAAFTRRRRYLELLSEHGHLVEREPGDDGNLPCGWPGRVGDSPQGVTYDEAIGEGMDPYADEYDAGGEL